MSLEVHECEGEMSYAIFGISLNSFCQCDHESEDHENSCCKSEKTTIEAKHIDKQVSKVIVANIQMVDFDINKPSEFIFKNLVNNNPNSLAFGTRHPPDFSPPLYILYDLFLI